MELEIDKAENEHIFLCFCSLVCITHNKKLNLPNIFLLVLKTDSYKNLLKILLTIDNDYDLFKYFIDYDYTISKSKYISKYLNSTHGTRIKKNVYGFTGKNIQRVPKRIKKVKKPTIQKTKRLHKNESNE
jgi:pantothenate kinase